MTRYLNSARPGIFAIPLAAAFLVFIASPGLPGLLAGTAQAQTTDNPFAEPIEADGGVVVVDVTEFAEVPDADGLPARMMRLVDEPGTSRMFVNDMRGTIYRVSYDGSDVAVYVDMNAWGVPVESGGRERGFQSFAFHPDFGQTGSDGYGHFYTYSDVSDTSPAADFSPGGDVSHHTVLHEWVAGDANATTYDGEAPRELIRFEQPFGNHNAGHVAFNPLASPGDDEYGLLYIGSADGGSGGDPMNLAQNLESAFGKVLRIDPLGSNSENGSYGIPPSNPFVGDGNALGEIYAYGVRNPQRFGWDPANGNLFLADIGQNSIETVSLVSSGANLGWNVWEGSFQYVGRNGVETSNPRSDAEVTYPVVEFAHADPLTTGRSAVTGVHVFRGDTYPQMQDRVLFADFVSGELLHFDADDLPEGGNADIRRMLLRTSDGEARTFLEIIREKNEAQGRTPTERTDVRIDAGPDDQVFLLNKHDGTIRRLVPGG
jgi:glucose/arabinose dehydrogenase